MKKGPGTQCNSAGVTRKRGEARGENERKGARLAEETREGDRKHAEEELEGKETGQSHTAGPEIALSLRYQ